jgi:adenine-specific DNA-methyltransferase
MLLEQAPGVIPLRMNKKQKLELTWIGKENRPRLEPRILLEDPEKSYHAMHRVTDHDLFDTVMRTISLKLPENLLARLERERHLTKGS